MRRRLRRTAGVLLGAALLVPVPAAAAAAGQAAATAADPGVRAADTAAGYRYWSFWTQAGDEDGEGPEWRYATQGPGTLRPADGTVAGFRFAVSADSREGERPRGTHSFDEICAGVAERDDRPRLALVIDFGGAEDAPRGEAPPESEPRTVCAALPDGGTVAEALAAEAPPLRYESSGLLCAISGYPERGCGEAASPGTAATDAPEDGDAAGTGAEDGGPGEQGVGIWLAAAAVAVLAAAALGRAARRRER